MSIVLQDGCDVLIRLEEDGSMDLKEVYFLDHETGIYAEPETFGKIPEIAAQ